MFEWDEGKRALVLAKHGIDLVDAARILDGPVLVTASDRSGERRWLAIGLLNQREIALIFTKRGRSIRLISARRARDNERKAYHTRFPHGAE